MSYRDVDLHGPNGDEVDVEFFTTKHRMQIGKIDRNLPFKRATEHPFRDIGGDSVNALLHGVHYPSMQPHQF
jgi:hypothetical protein